MKLTVQLTSTLDVEGKVDRLVGHAHLWPIRELTAERPGDLLRAPPQIKLALHIRAELSVQRDLPGLGARPTVVGTRLSCVGPVRASTRVTVPADLSAFFLVPLVQTPERHRFVVR